MLDNIEGLKQLVESPFQYILMKYFIEILTILLVLYA